MADPTDRRHASSWAPDEAGALYELGRPDYPATAVDVLTGRLGLGPGRRVLDVAAGTGKWTRRLLATGAQVVAVEPMPGMLTQLRQVRAPDGSGAAVVAGSAEDLPLRSGSVNVVTIAQALHWLRMPDAATELRRVLRPDGKLVVVYNRRDPSIEWVRPIGVILARYEALVPRPESTRRGLGPLQASGAFGPFERVELAHQQPFASLDEFDARFTSVSFALLLEPADREAMRAELRAAVAGVDPLVMPLRTDLDIATRT